MSETIRNERIRATMLVILTDCGYALTPAILSSAMKSRLKKEFYKSDFNSAFWQLLDLGLIRRLKDGRIKNTALGKSVAKNMLTKCRSKRATA